MTAEKETFILIQTTKSHNSQTYLHAKHFPSDTHQLLFLSFPPPTFHLKVLSSLLFLFSLHRATVHPELEASPAGAKRGRAGEVERRYLQMWRKESKKHFFFVFAKIKGWRDWTSQGQFHMPLRGPIVPTWNRTPLYAAALKNNVGPPHNRICGIPTGQQASATWNSLHWPWSGRAVWPPQQWQH